MAEGKRNLSRSQRTDLEVNDSSPNLHSLHRKQYIQCACWTVAHVHVIVCVQFLTFNGLIWFNVSTKTSIISLFNVSFIAGLQYLVLLHCTEDRVPTSVSQC